MRRQYGRKRVTETRNPALRRDQGANSWRQLRASPTLMRDGWPQVDPVWMDLEGDSILVCTSEGALKAKNTRRDARVGLSVVAIDNPYQEAQIRGRVVERRRDPDLSVIDRLARKYTGSRFRSGTSPPSVSCSLSRRNGRAT